MLLHMSYLEGIWLSEVDGAGSPQCGVHVHDLRGAVTERQVGDDAVLGVLEVGALRAVLGGPRENVMADHHAFRLAYRP